MNRPVAPRFHERGYLMVECLMYATVLMIVLGLAYSAFYRGLDNSRDLVRNADDIVRVLKAGEQWRADIRAAIGPVEVIADGPDSSMEIPRTNGVVVYLFTNGAVWRREGVAARWHPVLPQVKASHMELKQRTFVTAWTWEIELQSKKKRVRVRPLFSFLAVAPQRQTK